MRKALIPFLTAASIGSASMASAETDNACNELPKRPESGGYVEALIGEGYLKYSFHGLDLSVYRADGTECQVADFAHRAAVMRAAKDHEDGKRNKYLQLHNQ